LHKFGVGHELRHRIEIFFAEGAQDQPFSLELHLASAAGTSGSYDVNDFRFFK
jgi:hypothetical protein